METDRVLPSRPPGNIDSLARDSVLVDKELNVRRPDEKEETQTVTRRPR